MKLGFTGETSRWSWVSPVKHLFFKLGVTTVFLLFLNRLTTEPKVWISMLPSISPRKRGWVRPVLDEWLLAVECVTGVYGLRACGGRGQFRRHQVWIVRVVMSVLVLRLEVSPLGWKKGLLTVHGAITWDWENKFVGHLFNLQIFFYTLFSEPSDIQMWRFGIKI
jgi:hypothetical protein